MHCCGRYLEIKSHQPIIQKRAFSNVALGDTMIDHGSVAYGRRVYLVAFDLRLNR